MHWVFNVVVLKVNKIGAVLIRAIEPTLRMESMPNYRPIDSSRALTSDPRELVLA
ncbi:MAG: DNA-3-methyladenine glycosylase [Candidatus Bathyarchaeota archaeon]|jgi:3-methyladenine DNA glycosylase Mpg|nr:DNA-3-methyladenine glycosylase [Candidatus Bathyarchaeota archaeon]MDP7207178.1 DNA-3-methyladenine glycosylase [Candidatus Bathyarchaeota archaeon]MDP7443648.1 DNA-3-methyladenine glycosylase [Candidatus Bathyarchaeota archaeon]|tara:strand:- start:3669 stop:3833 length:165 start_codon:yes stop_codon:yes gene_type:complete